MAHEAVLLVYSVIISDNFYTCLGCSRSTKSCSTTWSTLVKLASLSLQFAFQYHLRIPKLCWKLTSKPLLPNLPAKTHALRPHHVPLLPIPRGAMSESRESCFEGIVFGRKVGFVIIYKILALHESSRASASRPCMHLMRRNKRQVMTAKWRPPGDFSEVFRAALIAFVVPHHRGSSTCSTAWRVIS
jgi:hypothetical protein